MRLKSLQLTNFRCFDDIEISFDDSLTVIVAENSGGKTAILDGVAVALGPFLQSIDSKRRKGFEMSDVAQRLRGADGKSTMEPQFPVELRASGTFDDKLETWLRALSGPDNHTTVKDARALSDYAKRLKKQISAEGGAKTILPVIAYYGTERLWAHNKMTEMRKVASLDASRLTGYVDCLNSASNYKSFVEWFGLAWIAHLEASLSAIMKDQQPGTVDDLTRMNALETLGGKRFDSLASPYAAQLAAVRAPIDQALKVTGWSGLHYDVGAKSMMMLHEDFGKVRVEWQSDGIRNVIGMVADLAYRMVKLNPALGVEAPQMTPGVVLIDEVDMHLHPRWQQVILGQLRTAFPKVQFIVTTHSPQVLTTVNANCIRILSSGSGRCKVVSTPLAQTRGVDSGIVLASVMDIDPIPAVQEAQDLQKLHALIQNGTWDGPEFLTLYASMSAHYGKLHPKMIDIDRLIRLERFKRTIPPVAPPTGSQ